MNISSALLIAAMIFDFLPTAGSLSSATHAASGAGELTAIVSESRGGTVARGATRVEVGTLTLSASCDADIKVESVDLLHEGLGSHADIRAVYLVEGFRRVTRARQFDAKSNEATVRATSIVVPKCEALKLSILVDIRSDASASGEHSVTLKGTDAIHSSAAKTTIQVGDSTERVIASPYTDGTVTLNFLPLLTRPMYGKVETVARIQVHADAKSNQLLKKITLTNRENARDMDLQNFSLQTRDGTVLTGPALRMHGRTVTLEFTPSFLIERSQTVLLYLKAEVRASITKKINFELEEPADLLAVPARNR